MLYSLRVRQMTTPVSNSTIKIIAVIMTPASVAFGMYWNVSVRNPMANITMTPVRIPPKGVRTPLALFTAVLVKEPVTGIARTKEPKMLQQPKAISSWVALIVRPFAMHLKTLDIHL